jgi:hypothetical protein
MFTTSNISGKRVTLRMTSRLQQEKGLQKIQPGNVALQGPPKTTPIANCCSVGAVPTCILYTCNERDILRIHEAHIDPIPMILESSRTTSERLFRSVCTLHQRELGPISTHGCTLWDINIYHLVCTAIMSRIVALPTIP